MKELVFNGNSCLMNKWQVDEVQCNDRHTCF